MLNKQRAFSYQRDRSSATRIGLAGVLNDYEWKQGGNDAHILRRVIGKADEIETPAAFAFYMARASAFNLVRTRGFHVQRAAHSIYPLQYRGPNHSFEVFAFFPDESA